MFKTIRILFICISFGLTAHSQSEEYKKELNKMFELSGSQELYKTYLDQMLPMVKDIFKDQDKEVWKAFKKEFSEIAMEELFDKLIPIYHNHLTLEDIQEINKFYKSSAGKKLVAKLPDISKESMVIGQEWGAEIGLKVQMKLKEKGLID